MSYAPYSEVDSGRIQGQFVEVEHGLTFEFGVPADGFLPFADQGFDKVIYLGRNETRFAKVLKTVAYVVVDEAEDGAPVVEKWKTKRFQAYTN